MGKVRNITASGPAKKKPRRRNSRRAKLLAELKAFKANARNNSKLKGEPEPVPALPGPDSIAQAEAGGTIAEPTADPKQDAPQASAAAEAVVPDSITQASQESIDSPPTTDETAHPPQGEAATEAGVPVLSPPNWGKPLTDEDHANLANCFITPELAGQAMLRRVDTIEGREILGQKGNRDCGGLLFSNYFPGDQLPRSYAIRRDNPEYSLGKDGKLKPRSKYLCAVGARNQLYIPPGVTPEQLADLSIPIVIVEGQKKALAMWRLANYNSEKPRFIPLSISGVWNWTGVVGKASGPRGERIDLTGPISDLSRVRFESRIVYILFDSNAATNQSVGRARSALARHLAAEQHADAKYIKLPEDCGVNGVDDLLAVWGPDRVLTLFAAPEKGLTRPVRMNPQFHQRESGMFRTHLNSKGELVENQLTNYQAVITARIVMDDGIEEKSDFEIKTELMGMTHSFTIPASEFTPMKWDVEKIAPTAITFPLQKEWARAAIQSCSLGHEIQRTYLHTGWRQIDCGYVYLHAGGAIGAAGTVAGVRVHLAGSLSRYELRLSADHEKQTAAVQASLGLLELAPPSVSFPLLAATSRAVFGNVDFSVHLVGESGAFKSELAALHQQHFGAGMNRKNLPGGWSSTGNALEVLAFYAKDALFTIDDFAPHGTVADVARYHATAARVFRAAGNNSSRQRLDSDAALREEKPPRALIQSTGEDIPNGHSIRARLLVVEVVKKTMSSERLTACQQQAADGLYAEAMGGFVRWIAPQFEEIQTALRSRILELRQLAHRGGGHARMPEMTSSLQAGLEFYLQYAEEIGAIDSTRRVDLARRSWDSLLQNAQEQEKHQAPSEPAGRFLALVRSALISGRAHLADRNGTKPADNPGPYGWRCRDFAGPVWEPQGDCVGWIDGEEIYLDATAAYRVVQHFGRDIGDVLPVSEQVLKKRLKDRGHLASIDEKRETLTVRRRIGGVQRDVLHFRRQDLLPEDIDSVDTTELVAESAVFESAASPKLLVHSISDAGGPGFNNAEQASPGRGEVKRERYRM